MARIFVSFSGSLGQELAVAIHDWLVRVAGADLYLAAHRVPPGKPWFEELSRELKQADCAILCVTRVSASAPWTHFEAGAAFRGSQVIPYLLDLLPSNLAAPLSLFQAARADRNGTLALLRALHLEVAQDVFEREWPGLAEQLARLRRKAFVRRWWVPGIVVMAVLGLGAYWTYLIATSIFPDFEPAMQKLNTANAAPLQVTSAACSLKKETCPRGRKHVIDAALSGGYATLFFDRWLPMDVQGRQIQASLIFRKGTKAIELGITDSGGNTAFFDCRSDLEAVQFGAQLRPDELLEAKCRINLASTEHISIGYASSAGKGNHGFDLLDLSLVSEKAPSGSSSTEQQCQLRRCSE